MNTLQQSNKATDAANAAAIARMQQRIAAVQALRASKNHARRVAKQQAAYMLAVQQLAAQYNMPVPNTMSVRAYNSPQKHAPSAMQGACGVVHAIADRIAAEAGTLDVRRAVLQECKATGINPATAATQYAKWHKAKVAEQTQQQTAAEELEEA